MNSNKKKKNIDIEKVTQVLMNNKAIIILIIFVAIVSCLTSDFFTSRNLTNILKQICTSCTLSMGFTLVLASGIIDLSVGYMLGLVGIISALMAVAGVPAVIVIPAAIVIGGICGILNGFISQKFGLQPFIVTLATGMIFQGINLIVSGAKSIANLPAWYVNIGAGKVFGIPIPVIVMVALVIVMYIVIQRTKFGRYALACGGNKNAARVCGIPTQKITYLVFLITGMCVGLAAVLQTGRAASAQNAAGAGMELDAVAAVVIGGTPMEGGKANVVGTLFGCLLIQVISNSLNLLGVDSNWQKVAKGLVIIAAIILDKEGSKILDKIRVKKVQVQV